jgi:DNA primase
MGDEVEIIKDRLDIVELVGERVALKKAGQHHKGLCPFHQEKSPSFIVSSSKRIWHCFGCNKGGDIFSFVQESEQLEFPEALAMLASRAGVELKKQSKQSSDKRQRIIELLDLSARFYHEILMNQPAGKKGKEYLLKRGVKEETMQQFQIGYAPKSWDALQGFLRHKSFSQKEMVEAGVVGESSRGTLYDRFRGRIIFPIEDVQGRVIAFGGRIAPWHETGEEGKYVNSPETTLYEKKRIIYNLHRAKQHISQKKVCLVVEGYMDVVMLVQQGMENVVASSGTAFTDEALTQLGRFTDNIHFAFDADAAGMKAATSATRSVLASSMRVGLIVLPSGSDPADLALNSPDKLEKAINEPQSLITVLMRGLQQAEGQDVEDFLEELLPLVKVVNNPVFQGEMIQEISGILHVPESRIIARLDESMAKKTNALELKHTASEITAEPKSITITPEQQLIGMFVAFPDVRQYLMKELKTIFILADDVKTLYNVLHGLVLGDKGLAQASADDLVAKIPNENLSLAEGLRSLSEERAAQSQEAVLREGEAILQVLKKRYLGRKLENLKRELSAGDKLEHEKVLQQIQKVQQERAGIS